MEKVMIAETDYNLRNIAEDDDLFEKEINHYKFFYQSRTPKNKRLLELRRDAISKKNKALTKEFDDRYICATCGAKDGAEHPLTGYCFYCDTDNWKLKE